MEAKALERIEDELRWMREELLQIRSLLDDEPQLADDVIAEIEESRRRPREELIPHEEICREFGVE